MNQRDNDGLGFALWFLAVHILMISFGVTALIKDSAVKEANDNLCNHLDEHTQDYIKCINRPINDNVLDVKVTYKLGENPNLEGNR